MITWILSNIGTIIVSLVIAGIIAFNVVKIIRDKKNGKSSCGCNCAHCAMAGQCHKDN